MRTSALRRSRREFSNEYLLAKFGLDTAENEPDFKLIYVFIFTIQGFHFALCIPSPAGLRHAGPRVPAPPVARGQGGGRDARGDRRAQGWAVDKE